MKRSSSWKTVVSQHKHEDHELRCLQKKGDPKITSASASSKGTRLCRGLRKRENEACVLHGHCQATLNGALIRLACIWGLFADHSPRCGILCSGGVFARRAPNTIILH